NVRSISLDNLFHGPQPKRVVLGFVSNAAFSGDITRNPFNFSNHNISYMSLFIDGEQIPSRPLQPDFTNGQFVESYHSLFSGTGTHYQDEGNGINRKEYPNGYGLFAFDLTPDLSANAGTHRSITRLGTFRIEVNFSVALTNALTCVIYAEFDGLVQINKQRNVIVEGS